MAAEEASEKGREERGREQERKEARSRGKESNDTIIVRQILLPTWVQRHEAKRNPPTQASEQSPYKCARTFTVRRGSEATHLRYLSSCSTVLCASVGEKILEIRSQGTDGTMNQKKRERERETKVFPRGSE